MKYLKTYNENQLIKDNLSNNGKTLNLFNLNLTKLPELPKGLKYLYCGNNKLTKLPEIPKGLRELYCHDNQLPYDNLEKYWEWFWKENPDLHNAKKMGLY